MSIITISHEAFGEGRAVAERVAAILGYRSISREVLVKASERYGIAETKIVFPSPVHNKRRIMFPCPLHNKLESEAQANVIRLSKLAQDQAVEVKWADHEIHESIMFGVLVLGTVVLVGALSFLPALVLGPLMELLQS